MTDRFLIFIEPWLSPEYIRPVAVVVGIFLAAVLIYFSLRQFVRSTIHLKDPLFDHSFRSFYGLMEVAVREHFKLFHNVPVTHVLQYSGLVNPFPRKLRKRHFDLLLCDPQKMEPKCAIVLIWEEQNSHKEITKLRRYCDKARLPLLVYEIRGMLDVAKLREDVFMATDMLDRTECKILGYAREHSC